MFRLVHTVTFQIFANNGRNQLQLQMRTIIIRKNYPDITMIRLLLLTLLLPFAAFATGLLLFTLLLPLAAQAADADYKPTDYKLVINDHRFQPAELTIPSGTKIKLLVENQDATPEEFDSHPLNREKVIAGHSTAMIYIGPLDPGRYSFTGEFHADTAQGVIIAQ